MKLAEALQERADLNRRIEALQIRINNNALYQEGEKPSEDPAELLKELDECTERLKLLISAINLKNAKYDLDDSPIDPQCDCPVCRRYSRAYIHHLFKAEEILALRLSVMHNLYFYNKLMERIREALDQGRFAAFRAEYAGKLDRRI